MSEKRLVVRVGGSISMVENGPNAEYFRQILPVLTEISKKNQLVVSVGGGEFVRKYYELAEKFSLPAEEKEWIAVELIRANVRFVSYLLNLKPIFSLEEIAEKTSGVIGGIRPGRSTDANAAYAAQKIKADFFVKLTNVDGVYDKDPNKFRDARKIDKMTFDDLKKLSIDGTPGNYGILDKTAVEILSKSRIPVIVADGRNPSVLLKILKGEKIGTVIS